MYTVRHMLSIIQTYFRDVFRVQISSEEQPVCNIFVTLVFLWSAEHIRMSFGHFAEFLRCPV